MPLSSTRDLAHIPQSHTSPRAILSSLSPRNPQHSQLWRRHDRCIQEHVEISTIEALLLNYPYRWVGYVFRIEDHRLSKIALSWGTIY